jgi:TetR/AcrR family transcriptional repressor of lmrAB and yxaGH operons
VPNDRYGSGVAPRLVSSDELIDRLTVLFRRVGYEAASLVEIAAATGLQKSSIYHRFPGGKEQMAKEVAEASGRQFSEHVLAPLRSNAPLEQRIDEVARNLDSFYEAGARSCLLDTMSLGDPGAATTEALATAAAAWIRAFAAVARQAGATSAVALARAQEAVAGIEGALVLARVTGDKRPFARALKRLPDILLGR